MPDTEMIDTISFNSTQLYKVCALSSYFTDGETNDPKDERTCLRLHGSW